MNASEKELIFKKLIKTKAKLEDEIIDLRELTQPIPPGCEIGRVSRMDAINNKSVTEAALRTSEEKLKTILLSIEKTEDPDFGICRKCGNPIPFERLMVMPGSSMCMSCARF